jgi:hypothetical protein
VRILCRWIGRRLVGIKAMKDVLLALINKFNVFILIIILLILGYLNEDYVIELIDALPSVFGP